MPSSTGAGRPFGNRKWKAYEPDTRNPTLAENAARTEANRKPKKKKRG